MATEQKVISVFGSSASKPGSADYESARTLGSLLAKAGLVIQTGGYSGVMSAVSQGAREANGHVIGVTCVQIERFRPMPANPWVVEEIKCQTVRERMFYLIDNCHGVIVMPGGIGTLSEFALLWSFLQVDAVSPRPIIAVGGLWQRTLNAFIDNAYVREEDKVLVTVARTVNEAVKQLVEQLDRI